MIIHKWVRAALAAVLFSASYLMAPSIAKAEPPPVEGIKVAPGSAFAPLPAGC